MTGAGFIYAIDRGEAVKIGWSADPIGRVKSLQVGSADDYKLIGVIAATRGQEAELHRLCGALRIRGEWFRKEGIILYLLSMLPKPRPSRPSPVRASKNVGIGRPERKRPLSTHPVRTWRLEKRMTLKTLATRVQCKEPHLCAIETRGKDPSISLALRLAAVTGLPLELVTMPSPSEAAE